ncbi:MAG: hypothetical protein NWE92_07455 [Candidatus Bathyarchaeota archaeon]|nr:hypothetical protein [Candidatus Bathyarchaeota archaeon]
MAVVRKTPYIDNTALKEKYIENRESYHQKMNRAFLSRTGNMSVEAFDDLFSAVESNDTSTLWERKASLAKSINDNKIDVMGALIGAISSYLGAIGILFPIILAVYTSGAEAFSDFLILGFLGILLFGLYEGYFSQCRLKRLVKEHKEYTCEFDEVTTLLERKKDLRIRKNSLPTDIAQNKCDSSKIHVTCNQAVEMLIRKD